MRRHRAFTLIELLVVISVIAVLMAILMPALMAAKKQAQKMVCCNNVRILGTANAVYSEHADGWYVPIMDRTQDDNLYWPGNQLFRTLVGYKDKQGQDDSDWHAPKEFRCPSDEISIKERPDEQYDSWLSYGYNLTDWYYSDWYAIGYAGHKNTTVRHPATELIFTESNDWWAWWKGANYVDGWDELGHAGITPYKEVGCDGPTLYRHNNGVNLAFYDGHVAHMKKEKVWDAKAYNNREPGMWSTFRYWPPSEYDQGRLPRP